jgi:citrate synthase
LHLVFAEALGLRPELTELVRRMLVLSADHAFEPGTFAVRVVASTGVTPWRAVMTGLAVATGRRSRFEQFAALRRFLAEVAEASDPADAVISRLRDGEALPGFDPGVYPDADPRGRALLDYCARAFDDPDFTRLRTALRVAKEVTGGEPNFALVSAYAERRLGLASAASGVSLSSSEAPFLVGRATGWIAHAIEQFQRGESTHRPVEYRGRLPG